MDALKAKDAEAIHTIIMNSGDAAFTEKYERALTAQAEMRKGLYFDDHSWRGIALPATVRQQLDYHFGIDALHQQNLLSHDGAQIELRVLATALPDKIIGSYFSFDPYEAARKSGIDYDAFKKELKAAYRGTVGRPGAEGFGILLDAAKVSARRNDYRSVIGLGVLEHPYDKNTVERLELRNADDVRVRQGRQVLDKNINPESVFLVTPEYSPLAIEVMAKILNFQGASMYMPAGIRR